MSFFKVLSVLIGILFFVCCNPKKEKQIVYVDNIELFNGFGMSKDMGKKYKPEIEKGKKTFDSLLTIYNILKGQKSTERLVELEEKLKRTSAYINQKEAYLTKEVSKQVWNRLNGYIAEYGKQKGYQMILGTQGNGNVMYAYDGLNITDELLEYANNKYEGNQ